MRIIPTHIVFASSIALSVVNLGLMAGQVTGSDHLPAVSGFDTPFPDTQSNNSDPIISGLAASLRSAPSTTCKSACYLRQLIQLGAFAGTKLTAH